MNATEAAYDAYLLALHVAGEVMWWAFQPVTLNLAFDCRLTPDFLVMYKDGVLEFHDTKGSTKIKTGKRVGEKTYHAEEDAAIKARVASALGPIPVFFVWSLGDGNWGKKGFGDV